MVKASYISEERESTAEEGILSATLFGWIGLKLFFLIPVRRRVCLDLRFPLRY